MRLIDQDDYFNDEKILEIANIVTNTYFKRNPDDLKKWGTIGKKHTFDDTIYTLKRLATAVNLNNIKIFNDYVKWLCIVLQSRGVSKKVIINHTEILIEVFDLENKKLKNKKVKDVDSEKLMQLYLEYLNRGLNIIKKFELTMTK
jgi:hypothetical protein